MTYVKAAPKAKLQHSALALSQSKTELVSSAILESGQQKSAVTDKSVLLRHASAIISLDYNIILLQYSKKSVYYKLMFIILTSKPSSLITQLSNI